MLHHHTGTAGPRPASLRVPRPSSSAGPRLRHALAAALLWLVDRLLGPVRARAGEAGMTTAEYAVGTIAACGFAAILYQVVTGDSIISALGGLISRALSTL